MYNIYQLCSSLFCSNSETVSSRNIKSIFLLRICFCLFFISSSRLVLMHESHGELRSSWSKGFHPVVPTDFFFILHCVALGGISGAQEGALWCSTQFSDEQPFFVCVKEGNSSSNQLSTCHGQVNWHSFPPFPRPSGALPLTSEVH